MSLHPGKQVSASLRLVRILGRGAMGSVWLADHLTLQSQVAVKFMAPVMAEDPVAVTRFQQEAKAAAEIRSPHVVQVFDHGQTDDSELYIVMELLEGDSLAKRVRARGALRPKEVSNIVSQVCKALAKAHARGIVHRDIKPSNVFLIDSGGDEFVKLLDFGVAKFSGEEAVNMTQAGNMVGTPAFMSPEQLFHGDDDDYGGDLWSVGVVAYYALTGTRPFRGRTLGELAVQIKEGTFERASEICGDLPPDIDAWFARALHTDRSSRFPTAKEMAQQLEHACGLSTMMTSTPSGISNQLQTFPGTTLSSPPGPMPARRDRRVPMVVGVVVAVALLGGAAGVVLLQQQTAASAAAPAAINPATKPTTSPIPPEGPRATSSVVDLVVPPVAASLPAPATKAVPPAPPRVWRRRPPTPKNAPSPATPKPPPPDSRIKDAAEKLGI